MSNARLKNVLASGLVALAALFGAASPAHAVVYVGNWDPAFGGIFPNLGFKGTATFSLPTACDGLTGTFLNSAAGCGGGAMQISSASVSFYNLAAPTVILQTLNFINPGAIVSVNLFTPTIIGSGFPSGPTQLTGVTSFFSTGVLGTIAESQFAGNSYNFYLGFSGSTTNLAYVLPECSANIANTATCRGFSSTSPTVTFTQAIPEPGTYALMMAGLAGLVFVARRRKSL